MTTLVASSSRRGAKPNSNFPRAALAAFKASTLSLLGITKGRVAVGLGAGVGVGSLAQAGRKATSPKNVPTISKTFKKGWERKQRNLSIGPVSWIIPFSRAAK